MKKFKKVYIEITNVCNLSCTFCPKTSRKPGFMELELFEKILSEVKDSSKYIYLHVLGEPFLHPKLDQILNLADKHSVKISITTNGTLIENVKEILLSSPAIRQINLSLHSFEANIKNYPVDNYLDIIFKFIEEAQLKTRISFTLRLWNLSEGIQNEENRYILRRIEQFFDLPYRIEEKISPVNGIKLTCGVFLNQASTFQWPVEGTKILETTGFCHGLRDQIAFLVDGNVVPCCLDSEASIILGNIKDQSLSTILAGYRASNMYNGFSGRKVIEPLCQKCSYRLKFSRHI